MLRYSSGIIVFKKCFHSERSMLYRPTLHDDRRLQTALPGDVFHRATYKDVGMALNVNRLIVSALPCTFFSITSVGSARSAAVYTD